MKFVGWSALPLQEWLLTAMGVCKIYTRPRSGLCAYYGETTNPDLYDKLTQVLARMSGFYLTLRIAKWTAWP